jgi:hypothetical protein
MVFVTAAATLAACNGPGAPHVASLGRSSSHGDPEQPDPTIDVNKDIDIEISPSVQGGIDGNSGSGRPGLPCRAYLTAAPARAAVAEVTAGMRPMTQEAKQMKQLFRRSVPLGVLVAAAALALAACGGSTHPPAVASLKSTTSSTTGEGHGGGRTTNASRADNPTQLMDEWAVCMRSNGDPTQTDPVIDSHGVINITLPLGVPQALSSEIHSSTGPCSQYEVEAEAALRAADPVAPPPDEAQLVRYTDCMRANGVPNYPDPGPDGKTDFQSTGVDPNSPSVQNANKVCGKQIDAPAWWINGWGPPGDVSVMSAGLSPNGPPPCAYAKAGCGNGSHGAVVVPGGNGGAGATSGSGGHA